ncbi:MAG TPA: hypothetical protein VI980_09270 [Acidimicrobiia bacterium]|nr:hypothetical protein [Acidimicrobiia bacterium]
MRRTFAFLAVGALTALAIGSAATLAVNGGAIQAGEDLTLFCDPDGVQVRGWGLETNDGLVYFVRIGGIADACQGNAIFVRVTDGGVLVASGSVDPLTAAHTGAGQVVVPIPGGYPAANINDLHVFIEGPNGS